LKKFQQIVQNGGPDSLNEIVKAARQMLLKTNPEYAETISAHPKKKRVILMIITSLNYCRSYHQYH